MDSIKILQQLLSYKSITGADDGVILFLKKTLSKIGFKCDILDFEDPKSYPVKNLHATYNPNNSKNILYFAGHTDVVPLGDGWDFDPFAGEIKNDKIYGRGVVDMKGAIASFICAVAEFNQTKKLEFGIGFLITGDEEGDAINGTVKMLDWMKSNKKPMTNCIIGEPTNPNILGEEIKNGRRGSINFSLIINGKQGHVAYPQNAINPIAILTMVLEKLNRHEFDNGNEFFLPTNLEIVEISNSESASNVIPEKASAKFNIRFSSEHSSTSIIKIVKNICTNYANDFNLEYIISGESFLTKPCKLLEVTQNAVFKVTQNMPQITTTGGTSDARFIKDFCPVVECGLVNKTAHQTNENTAVENIYNLQKIYAEILRNYE
ncbi:succinyl-diaminopimelate desuccinylase [Flavobacteriaceae bacterium]|nr:succinyl-diaminopimelate desuccinylase [Flavobacteriaceae bacterium]